MVVSLIYVYDLFVIGSSPSVTSLDKFGDHLHYQAFSASMHRNVQSHLKVFLQFCNNFHFHSFSLQPIVLSCYVAHLAQLGHWSGTIQNHISSLKQFQEYMVLLWAGNKIIFLNLLCGVLSTFLVCRQIGNRQIGNRLLRLSSCIA